MATRLVVSSALAAGLITATAIVTSPATAAPPVHTQQVAMNCLGLSPNIIDLPYNGGVRIQTRTTQPGTITLIGGSNSAGRYLTDATITIRNLTAHTSGTISKRYLHTTGGSATGGYTVANIYTGRGRVSITIRAINHGLITLTAPTCTDTITVKLSPSRHMMSSGHVA